MVRPYAGENIRKGRVVVEGCGRQHAEILEGACCYTAMNASGTGGRRGK